MHGLRDLACRRFGREHLPGGLERARDLDAEVDRHGRASTRAVMVEKQIVPARVQAGVLAQERPNLIEGRAPRTRDFPDHDLASDSGKLPRLDGLHAHHSVSHGLAC